MNKKGIFMPLLAFFTASLFIFMFIAFNDGEVQKIRVGTPVQNIFDSYSEGEIVYYNYENIVGYSLDSVLSKNFPKLFEKNTLNFEDSSPISVIPSDINLFLVVEVKKKLNEYGEKPKIKIESDILFVEFDKFNTTKEFLNGNFNYVVEPTVKVDLTEIKKKIADSKE